MGDAADIADALTAEIASWERRRDTIRAYWRPPSMPDYTISAAYNAALSELEDLCPNMGSIDAEDRCTLAIATLRAFSSALPRRTA